MSLDALKLGKIKTFDASQGVVIFGGHTCLEFAPDVGLEITFKNTELFKTQVGLLGHGVRSKVINFSATMKLRFMRTSPSNDKLFQFMAADMGLPGGAPLPFSYTDGSGNTALTAASAYVVSLPNPKHEQEAGIWEWGLETHALVGVLGGQVAA